MIASINTLQLLHYYTGTRVKQSGPGRLNEMGLLKHCKFVLSLFRGGRLKRFCTQYYILQQVNYQSSVFFVFNLLKGWLEFTTHSCCHVWGLSCACRQPCWNWRPCKSIECFLSIWRNKYCMKKSYKAWPNDQTLLVKHLKFACQEKFLAVWPLPKTLLVQYFARSKQ